MLYSQKGGYAMLKLVLLSFVALLFLASSYSPVSAENQCVPLPIGTVPDESSRGWTEHVYPPAYLTIEVQTKNGERITIGARKYYIHDNGMKLGVYSYFGKVGFKAWSCDKDRDPVTRATSDHMIAVSQPDGDWFIKHAQSPDKEEVIFGADGKPEAVRITLHRVETLFKK